MTVPDIRYPRPAAHLLPYVEALGPELAVRFFLEFGGARLYLPDVPRGNSEAEKLLGADRFRQLAEAIGTRLTVRVPVANPWLVASLAARGMSRNEIARTVRLTEVTVAKMLRIADKRQAEGKAV